MFVPLMPVPAGSGLFGSWLDPKTMKRPSGDHCKFELPFEIVPVSAVKGTGLDPSAFTFQIFLEVSWGPLGSLPKLRFEVKAIWLPSGDHWGSSASTPTAVIWVRGLRPL